MYYVRSNVETGSRPDVPLQFRSNLQQAKEAEQRYLHAGDPSALDTAAAAWERILTTQPCRLRRAFN